MANYQDNFIIQSPLSKKSKVEGYMHKNSIAFAKKTIDETAFYFATMEQEQRVEMKSKFSFLTFYNTDLTQEEIMSNDSPFTGIEPTMPDDSELSNKWVFALVGLVLLAVIALGSLIIL